MDNSFVVNDKNNTFKISIEWQSEMDADDKYKIYKILIRSLELWDGQNAFSEKLSEIQAGSNAV